MAATAATVATVATSRRTITCPLAFEFALWIEFALDNSCVKLTIDLLQYGDFYCCEPSIYCCMTIWAGEHDIYPSVDLRVSVTGPV